MKVNRENEIGERLLKLRQNLGLTQKQFAERLSPKTDYTYIGKLERGDQLPSLYFLTRVTRAYSVLLGYFFDTKTVDLWDYYSRVKDLVKTQENLSHQVVRKLDQISKAITNSENWLAERITMAETHKVKGEWENEFWRGYAEALHELKKRENF